LHKTYKFTKNTSTKGLVTGSNLAGGKKGGRVRQEYQQGTRVGLIYVLVLNAKRQF